MANKRYDQFVAGTVTQEKIFLLANPTTGALEKVTISQLTPQKTITFAGSPYTVLPADYTIFVNAIGGAVDINLPLASSFSGRILNIKMIDNAGNPARLQPAGADNIEGTAGTFSVSGFLDSVMIQSDGVNNWWVLSNNP